MFGIHTAGPVRFGGCVSTLCSIRLNSQNACWVSDVQACVSFLEASINPRQLLVHGWEGSNNYWQVCQDSEMLSTRGVPTQVFWFYLSGKKQEWDTHEVGLLLNVGLSSLILLSCCSVCRPLTCWFLFHRYSSGYVAGGVQNTNQRGK